MLLPRRCTAVSVPADERGPDLARRVWPADERVGVVHVDDPPTQRGTRDDGAR